jgi:tetratricopeptide (TPR) repeat protein
MRVKRALSALTGRDEESELRDETRRVLVERRCDLYVRVAGHLLDIEDALDRDDPERARFAFEEARRALRSSLAFVNEEVVRALEQAEVVLLPSGPGSKEPALPGTLEEEARDRVQVLHVRLARMLALPGADVAKLLGGGERLERKLAEDEAAVVEKARRREVEEKLKTDERIARELIGQKQFKKALRHLKRAVRLDPERAVLRNDLGVVYGLLGCHEQAVEEYRAAVALNEKHADRRTDEWTTSYRNLGIALLKLAAEEEEGGELGRALLHTGEAKAAFTSFLEVTPDGPRLAEARSLARRAEEELRWLDEQRAASEREQGKGEPEAVWHGAPE